jgi:sec-independent protein translocase protein TatA
MFGGIGMPELFVILVIALVIFGPGKLPHVGKSVGEAIRGFKKSLNEPESSPLEDTEKTSRTEGDRK